MNEAQSSQPSPQAQAPQSARVSPIRPDRRAAHILRLRRIEGQAKGLQRMIDEDKSCVDVLTQISAITHALNALGLELLNDEVRDLVARAADEGADADALAERATVAVARLARS